MSRLRILIVGGSDAGTSAALAARETDPHCDIDVLLEDRFPNFSVCGIPFLLSGEVPGWRDLAHRPEEEFARRRIRLHKQHRATSVRRDHGEVLVASSDGETSFEYDRLVLATGAEAITPKIVGAELAGVHQVRTMGDGIDVLEHIDSTDLQTAVIVGGGYIGVELADAFNRRGIGVTLVESTDQPLKTLDPQLGALIADELIRHDVKVAAATRVESIEVTSAQERRSLRVCGTGGFEVVAELVVLCIGVKPRTELADGLECERGAGGATRVSRRMETTVAGIFAAGDCVETWHRLLKRPTFSPLGTTAHKQGAIAGANAVGAALEFAGTLGTQVVKVFDLAAGRTGLTESEASREAFVARTTEIVTLDHKAYYPGAQPLHIRITGDVRDGRLLGAQIVGDYRASVAKRLDAIATALFSRLRVSEILDLDLSYTPPLGSPWDPWQVAARAWCDEWSNDRSAGRERKKDSV